MDTEQPSAILTAPTPGPLPALARFRDPVRAWFTGAFRTPTLAQQVAWPPLLAGETTLILAPTGSGKTLAAFLAAIDRLMFAPVPPPGERCRVLYVSPLKALAVDVERNLRAPLAGVAGCAAESGAHSEQREVFPGYELRAHALGLRSAAQRDVVVGESGDTREKLPAIADREIELTIVMAELGPAGNLVHEADQLLRALDGERP